jgi:hypothetical protein
MESGSWFRGRIYSLRSDVSPDGKWMVYLALGAGGKTWNALCNPPRLTAIAQWDNTGTWFGGGYFDADGRLLRNTLSALQFPEGPSSIPQVQPAPSNRYSSDECVLYPRLERDGWQRAGPFGTSRRAQDSQYAVICDNDAGWFLRPSAHSPMLRVFYRGYLGGQGHKYEFRVDEHPELLNSDVDWACWDSLGQLIVARLGVVERYRAEDFESGSPSLRRDLNDLRPPPDRMRPRP